MDKKELKKLIEKRARGFSYSEEVCEYETKPAKKYLFCEDRKRLYINKKGYLRVEKLLKNGEITALLHKNIKEVTLVNFASKFFAVKKVGTLF